MSVGDRVAGQVEVKGERIKAKGAVYDEKRFPSPAAIPGR